MVACLPDFDFAIVEGQERIGILRAVGPDASRSVDADLFYAENVPIPSDTSEMVADGDVDGTGPGYAFEGDPRPCWVVSRRPPGVGRVRR